MSSLHMITAYTNQDVSMVCFFSGILLMLVGLYVWIKKRPDILPGYKRVENENTAAYARFFGQALMFAGAAVFVLSVPLHDENPDKGTAVMALFLCLVLLAAAMGFYILAVKVRRK